MQVFAGMTVLTFRCFFFVIPAKAGIHSSKTSTYPKKTRLLCFRRSREKLAEFREESTASCANLQIGAVVVPQKAELLFAMTDAVNFSNRNAKVPFREPFCLVCSNRETGVSRYEKSKTVSYSAS